VDSVGTLGSSRSSIEKAERTLLRTQEARRVKHVKIRRGCAFACRRGYRVIGDGTPARPGYKVVQALSLSPIGGVGGVYFMLCGLGDYCGQGFLARAAS